MLKIRTVSLIVSTLMFLFVSAPFSSADDPSAYTAVLINDPLTVLLAADSTVVIDAASVTVDSTNVYTFSGFDPGLSPEIVPDPESYVLSSGGVLLQPDGSFEDPSNLRSVTLTQLIADNNVTVGTDENGDPVLAEVTDLSSVMFTFAVDQGHNVVSLDFLLASGEYFEGDWDIAGIYIDGTNYAFLPNGNVLRVNEGAQITNVCAVGFPDGCMLSDYYINGDIIGTMSPKLTMYASIDSVQANHTFVAIVANTNDNVLPTSLLISNLQSFQAQEVGISTFTLGDQVFDFGIQVDEEVVTPPAALVPDPNQFSEITGISVSATDASNNVTITLTGTFVEVVRAIEVNGRRVSSDVWKQASSSLTLTVPAVSSGTYVVDVWNGSLPLLQRQTVVAATK